MKVIVEFVPRKRKEETDLVLGELSKYIDCFDIPESPLGNPMPNAVATSIYIKEFTGKCVIAHIRLYDVNRIGLLSLALAAQAYGVDGVVLTRGDKPRTGIAVNDIDTIKAIKLLEREVPELRVGAIISLRYPLKDIIDRINAGASFYLVLRFSREYIDKYMRVLDVAEKQGVILYPYIIVSTEKNQWLIDRIGQPHIPLSDLEEFLEDYKDILYHGIVLSVPLDLDGLIESLKIACRIRVSSRKALLP